MDRMNPHATDRATSNAWSSGRAVDATFPGDPCAIDYARMSAAYAMHNGLATGDEVLGWMRTRAQLPVSALARLIVGRRIVSFCWKGRLLLPLFQFGEHDMGLRVDVMRVVTELRDALDDWQVALWFAAANARLDDARPVDVIATRPSDVLDAARAERFLHVG